MNSIVALEENKKLSIGSVFLVTFFFVHFLYSFVFFNFLENEDILSIKMVFIRKLVKFSIHSYLFCIKNQTCEKDGHSRPSWPTLGTSMSTLWSTACHSWSKMFVKTQPRQSRTHNTFPKLIPTIRLESSQHDAAAQSSHLSITSLLELTIYRRCKQTRAHSSIELWSH